MNYCGHCGAVLTDDAAFCTSCGSPVPRQQPETEDLNPPRPPSDPIPESPTPATRARRIWVIGGVAAALLLVAIVGIVLLRSGAEAPAPTNNPGSSPAGWTPEPSMINGTAPAVMPEQCRAPGAPAPSLKLTNGQAPIPGTKNGKFTLIGTPVKGRFTVGGPEYTAYAFTCIGDGNYAFTELVLVDGSGAQVPTYPPTTQDAVAPVAEKFAPGKSLDSVGPFQFSAVEGAPSLQGKWGFHGSPTTLLARVSLAQSSPGTLVNQVAVPLQTPPVAPNISEGMSYYEPESSGGGESTLLVMRTGDSIRYQQGFSGGITCFRGKISAEKLVGTREEFGEIDTPITSKKTSIAFTATDDSLSLGQDSYAKGGDPSERFDPRCA